MKYDIVSIGKTVKAELGAYNYRKGYNPDNALEAVRIVFSTNERLKNCTPESIHKSILSMLVQGLNPLKGQCYFVPYRRECQLIRDYSGSIMVAQDVDKDIWRVRSKIVREGDEFDFEIDSGMYRITRHKPTLASLNGAAIAAYTVAVNRDGKVIDSEIMSYEQYMDHCRRYGKPVNGEPLIRRDGTFHPKSNHAKHPDKMYIKTVIKQLCDRIIKTSGNEDLQEADEHTIDEDVEITVTETAPEEIETIDFEAKPDQATDEQCKAIFELEKHAGREKDILKTLSEHFGRQITGLKKLTSIEANSYINRPIDPDPETEVDEQPPWK